MYVTSATRHACIQSLFALKTSAFAYVAYVADASPLSTVVLELPFLPSASSLPGIALNTRPYGERGWTIFEDTITREVMAWLQMLPLDAMFSARGACMHKLYVLDEDGTATIAKPR